MSLNKDDFAGLFHSEKLNIQYKVQMSYNIVRSVEMTPSKSRICFIMDKNQLVMWRNLYINKFSFSESRHRESSLCLKLLPKAELFATASSDKTMSLWNLNTAKASCRFKEFTHKACYIVFGERERQLVVIDHSGNVLLLDTVSKKPVKFLPTLSMSFWLSATFDFCFTKNSFLGVENKKQNLVLFRSFTKERTYFLVNPSASGRTCCLCLRKSKRLALTKINQVWVLNTETKKVVHYMRNIRAQKVLRKNVCRKEIFKKVTSIQCMGTDRTENLLFLGCNTGVIGVYSIACRGYLFVLKQAKNLFMVRRTCHPDFLAVCGRKESSLKIFDIPKLLTSCPKKIIYNLWD